MVQPSEPDSDRDSADGTAGDPESADASDQRVPDKQIHRWKDDGGALLPDS